MINITLLGDLNFFSHGRLALNNFNPQLLKDSISQLTWKSYYSYRSYFSYPNRLSYCGYLSYLSNLNFPADERRVDTYDY